MMPIRDRFPAISREGISLSLQIVLDISGKQTSVRFKTSAAALFWATRKSIGRFVPWPAEFAAAFDSADSES